MGGRLAGFSAKSGAQRAGVEAPRGLELGVCRSQSTFSTGGGYEISMDILNALVRGLMATSGRPLQIAIHLTEPARPPQGAPARPMDQQRRERTRPSTVHGVRRRTSHPSPRGRHSGHRQRPRRARQDDRPPRSGRRDCASRDVGDDRRGRVRRHPHHVVTWCLGSPVPGHTQRQGAQWSWESRSSPPPHRRHARDAQRVRLRHKSACEGLRYPQLRNSHARKWARFAMYRFTATRILRRPAHNSLPPLARDSSPPLVPIGRLSPRRLSPDIGPWYYLRDSRIRLEY